MYSRHSLPLAHPRTSSYLFLLYLDYNPTRLSSQKDILCLSHHQNPTITRRRHYILSSYDYWVLLRYPPPPFIRIGWSLQQRIWAGPGQRLPIPSKSTRVGTWMGFLRGIQHRYAIDRYEIYIPVLITSQPMMSGLPTASHVHYPHFVGIDGYGHIKLHTSHAIRRYNGPVFSAEFKSWFAETVGLKIMDRTVLSG